MSAVVALTALLALASAITLEYFLVGRLQTPARERVPLAELGLRGVLHTLVRGAETFALSAALTRRERPSAAQHAADRDGGAATSARPGRDAHAATGEADRCPA
ncbi:hypothetical protein [Brevibacterium samyangense]|uniref:DUF21 domain-containing protein n=1 Tax=Brevibacterium samyangense TaxID=366888 RepID=A0ABN2TK39_9MICO